MAGGGRPACREARHFTHLKELGEAGGGYSFRECSFCRAAFNNNVTTTLPKAIIGRARNYVNHLAKCEYYQAAQLGPASTSSSPAPETPPRAQNRSLTSSLEATPAPIRQPLCSGTGTLQTPVRSSSRIAVQSRARRTLALEKRLRLSPNRPHSSHKRRKPTSTKKLKKQRRKFTKGEVNKLECSLIELHADNHLPDRFIEQSSTLQFLELLCPGITDYLPSRRTLSNRILKEHAKRCKSMETDELRAKEERTQGWVNLLSDVWQNISKDHLLGCQLALFGVILTYALLPAGDRHHGIAIAEQLEQVLLQAQQEKWKAVNNLVKAVLRSSFRGVAAKAATAVNTLNASSSKWLPRARKVMKKFYGKPLGLRTLCETRWNSMQGCFASLLRVQSALQMFHRQYKRASDFSSQLHVLGDPAFWDELREAEAVIAPLSLASYRLQRDENTVGDVVRSFGDIYKGFQQHLVHQEKLIECVEDRWEQCEQPLFMLGFALHPVYVECSRELPETAVSGIGTLAKIAVYYYRRLFGTEEIGQLRRDMLAWTQRRFTRMKPSEFLDSPWEYWEGVALEKPKSLLPKLAMRVLSIAVNTATCERLFSELGLIHTAKRNRMTASKALDFHIVAKHVRQRAQKDAAAFENPKKKLLISPEERQIILDAANYPSLFTSSPQQHGAVNAAEDSDSEDPGDGVDGDPTLNLWGEFLDEVFEDEEIGAGYEEADRTSVNTCVRDSRDMRENKTIRTNLKKLRKLWSNHSPVIMIDPSLKKPSNCEDFVDRK